MYIEGEDREQWQLLPARVDDYVAAESPVRAIEAFVDALDMAGLGFEGEVATTGRPGYDPRDLLKLYTYGYLYRVRSSRRLEAETYRNLEVIWLLKGLRPDHWTIAAFRREHAERFKSVLREFNLLCRKLELFGAELVAIDGAKFKAVNSAQRHYTRDKLQALIERVDARIAEYVQQLDTADAEQAGVSKGLSKETLEEKLRVLRERKARHEQTQEVMGDQSEVSLTDADSRGQKKVGVGYNVQIAVDSKHHLIVAETVTQDANDVAQLAPMAEAAQNAIEANTVVADAGYHERGQLARCEKANITTFVPAPATSSGITQSGIQVFPKERFTYDEEKNEYTCPAGECLPRIGGGLKHGKHSDYYANPQACARCFLRKKCTTAVYRRISRLENEAVVERQAQRLAANPKIMRDRKKIVEHVFGTLRIWGHDSFLCRGLSAVRAEFSLSALAYNLRRAINVLGTAFLANALKTT